MKANTAQQQNQKIEFIDPVIVPNEVRYQALGKPETRELLEKVEELEKEKSILLKQISTMSVSSLDPKSEVNLLLKQVHEGIRPEDSISSLFTIKSPISFEPLQAYFLEHFKGDRMLLGQLNTTWYDFFISVDEEAGFKFALSQLESERKHSHSLYSFLARSINSKKRCDLVTDELKRIAATNPNSEVRANAKLLLTCNERENIKSLEFSSDDKMDTHLRIFVIFSEFGISDDFLALISRSNRVRYWSTSSYLYEMYKKSDFSNEKYLNALEKISTIEMSTSSKAFTLYLLGEIYGQVGKKGKAKGVLEQCNKLAPVVCGELSKAKNTEKDKN